MSFKPKTRKAPTVQSQPSSRRTITVPVTGTNRLEKPTQVEFISHAGKVKTSFIRNEPAKKVARSVKATKAKERRSR